MSNRLSNGKSLRILVATIINPPGITNTIHVYPEDRCYTHIFQRMVKYGNDELHSNLSQCDALILRMVNGYRAF
jgi:hypothetical protein